MKPGKVRAIAICIFSHNSHILVAEGYDEVKKQLFYRPLGGTIEFSEYGHQTIHREIREELNLGVKNIRYLGTLENVFTYNGKLGHEIVLVFDGEFEAEFPYTQKALHGMEDTLEPIKAVWMSPDEFGNLIASKHINNRPPLYPTGLLELLKENL